MGVPRPELIFFKNGEELTADGYHYFINYADDGSIRLTVHVATDEDDAEYVVLAENIAGSDKCLFELFVESPGGLTF